MTVDYANIRLQVVTMSLRPIRLILFFAIMMIAFDPRAVRACGSTDGWIGNYVYAADDRQREAALREISSFCGGYTAGATGKGLAGVVLDAHERRMPKKRIRQILELYRCLPDVSDDETGNRLKSLIGEIGARCPSKQSFVRVKVDYTIGLKKRANRSSESLGFMGKDELLDFLSRQGAWVKVRHWNDVTGFVRSSQVEAFPAR